MKEPHPSLDKLLVAIGEAGRRMSDIGACEGAAGNISVYAGWHLEVDARFSHSEPMALPQPAPSLTGKTLIVTGSGCRLRDVLDNPEGNLGVVRVGDDGLTGQLLTSSRREFKRITGEFNSHLATHNDRVARTGTTFHALIHAQPPHLVYLSHIPAYRDREMLNRRLLRWEPETIIELPEGLGMLPFLTPGSQELRDATVEGFREHRLVLWSKHGVMARSDLSVTHTADIIEYAEAAAKYEYMDLVAGNKAEGLTPDELRAVAKAFNVQTKLVLERE